MPYKHYSRRGFISNSSMFVTGLMFSGGELLYPKKAFAANDSISIGLIGCGSRGIGLAMLFKNIPGVRLTACCDILPVRVNEGLALGEKGAKGYSDYRKLLENKDMDAVIIATPLYLHYPMTIAAVQARRHVYLEKSLAYDVAQTLKLPKIVKDSGVVFQVGYQYRYYSMYRKAKAIIDSGWLGQVTHFECQYNQNSDWRRPVNDPKLERIINWRMYREYCGGPLSELCAHQIDMVNYITSAHPLSAVGMGGINYWKDGRETYDNIRVIYEYPGGITSTCTSILSNGYNGYNIRVLGDKATLDIQRNALLLYAEPKVVQRSIVDGVTGASVKAIEKKTSISFREPGEPDVEPTTFAINDFIGCIREKRTPVSNVDTAVHSSLAIHMGNRAAETRTQQLWKPEYGR